MKKEDLMDEEPVLKGKKDGGWRNSLRVVIMMVALCVFLYSAYNLFYIFMEYRDGEKEYEDLQKYAVAVEEPEAGSETGGADGAGTEEDKADDADDGYVEVDFAKLQAINPEVVGWIYFPGVGINYPVTKTTDNSYYLTHTFEGTENSAGSIFMDFANDGGFADTNTFLYGHNMKNGSMFGLLGRYKKEAYFREHPYFWICTPTGKYKYQIFSCYVTDAASKSYTRTFAAEAEYAEYLDMLRELSGYDTGVDVTTADRMVSLSTCTSISEDSRFLVHGKLVESVTDQAAQK